ncbi:MAG: M48 family metallopeptidase [Myxococcaceae bacterium]
MRTLRVALHLAVITSFYLFAIALALGTEAAGVWLFGYSRHLPGRAALAGFLAGFIVMAVGWVLIYSLWPRSVRFKAPGPELYASQHKQLFRELSRIAAFAGVKEVDHVYLLPAADLWVRETSGFLGIGRKRVMGIGLLVLNVLTVSELRAVLAHEMGHFLAGDSRLGLWLFRARGAAEQTLTKLVEAGELIDNAFAEWLIFLVSRPFVWFLPFYLKLSRSQMRHQELNADQLAVRLEGTEPFCSGLSQVIRAHCVFPTYVAETLAPALATGHLPPLGQSFRAFFTSPEGQALASLGLTAERLSVAHPLDTHPPFSERFTHARKLSIPARSKDDRLSIELLADVGTMEKVLAKDWPRAKPAKAAA